MPGPRPGCSPRDRVVGATAWLLLVAAGLTAAACGEDDKVGGWPRVWGPQMLPELVPPDAEGAPRAGAVVDSDAGPAEPAVAARAEGCRRLVERACELLGPHTEECAEARGRMPRVPAPAAIHACEETLAAFEEYLALPRRVSPCLTLARRICAARGRKTEVCEAAITDANRLVRTEQKMACAGDLLLWDARQLLVDQ